VLHNSSFGIKSEDVDPSVVTIAGPLLVTLKYDEITFGNDTFELDALTWIVSRHPLEVLDKRFLPVSDMWIVLNVRIANEPFYCLSRSAAIEHQVVELFGSPLVAIQIMHYQHSPLSCDSLQRSSCVPTHVFPAQ